MSGTRHLILFTNKSITEHFNKGIAQCKISDCHHGNNVQTYISCSQQVRSRNLISQK